MITRTRAMAMLLGAATMLTVTTEASATYFVRPVLQYGPGELVDGLSLNDETAATLIFNDGFTRLEADVALADGTIKTYVGSQGPQTDFLIATAIYGDTIRYFGSETETVAFFVDFEGLINSSQFDLGSEFDDTRYIGIQTHFAVYEAGTGATYLDWTTFGSQTGTALYNASYSETWNDFGLDFSTSFSTQLGDDLLLTNGGYYEVYVAFNLLLNPGLYGGSIEMDSLNTSTLTILAPGGEITSESGDFLGFAQTPAAPAIPEPATWAMLIAGFGLVGAAARRRRNGVLA